MNLKQTIKQLLPGWNGRLAAHHVAYLADGHVHRAVPYTATDPKVIAKKLSLMQSAGIDVVIATWQGPFATSCHLDATTTSSLCAEYGLQFALLLDPWCAKLYANGSNTNYTVNVQNALNNAGTQTMLNASSYVPEKFILDFNTGAVLTTLAKDFPSYKFLAQGAGFSWISIPAVTDSVARNAASITNLQGQNKNAAMKIPGVCMNFDDSGQPQPVNVQSQATFDAAGGIRNYSNSVWGGNARVLESFAGQFFAQQVAVTPLSAPIIALITWDDYDEQSSGPYEKVLAESLGINWTD